MSSQALNAADNTVSIGAVVEILSAEFDDVTVSRMRFWDAEGLINPARTQSGYRRYTDEDIRRLRYILTAQRDYFLPLPVIKQQLERVDAGEITLHELETQTSSPLVATPPQREDFSRVSKVRLTERSLCMQAEVDPEFLDELLDADLIRPTGAGFYVEDDLIIVEACKGLHQAGIDTRHLRSYRTSIDYLVDLVRRSAGATGSLQTAESKGHAAEKSRDLANVLIDLSAGLLKQRLRDVLEY